MAQLLIIRQIKTLATLYGLMIPSLIGMTVVTLSVQLLQLNLAPIHLSFQLIQLKQSCTTFTWRGKILTQPPLSLTMELR